MKIKINGKIIETATGKTILEATLDNKILIPNLCYHPDLKPTNHCKMCVVEIKGSKKLQYACSTKAKNGMEILTESPKLQKQRTKNLEKILKKHLLECDDCVWNLHCKLLDLVEKYKVKPKIERNKNDEILQYDSIVFDQTKCIGCGNCVKICPVNFLKLNKRKKIEPSKATNKDCINCGQCILHCPVGAIEGIGEFEELENVFKDKNKIAVVQFAPSIRTSIGEEFGFPNGKIMTEQLIAGLKKLGFNYVFDTAFGADFTTMEESDELIERLAKNKRLPAMSSCCPSWVRFVEFYYPEFIPNLCTARSPQTMLGGIIKKFWAKKIGAKPENIFVVSIMPCVSKKFEIKRKKLKINNLFPVDLVLTTRELVRLLKKNNIDLKNIEPKTADDPFGSPSGAGVIYGSSGGVFESALRTACFKMTGNDLGTNAVKNVRGTKGIKEMKIKINGREIKVCVANGIKNAAKILKEIKKNPQKYDAIEVMACPGGCVGGGGQLLPTSLKIIEKRGQSLYAIDQAKIIKSAHKNEGIKKVYEEFFAGGKNKKEVLHTNFAPRKKSEFKKLKNSKETYA
jgi:NADH-quinone oxidoreductase subunit G